MSDRLAHSDRTGLYNLEDAVGGYYGGNSLKAIGQGGGTNSSGFSALLAGVRGTINGELMELGINAIFWSSTKLGIGFCFTMHLYFDNPLRFDDTVYHNHGFSVRCIKD